MVDGRGRVVKLWSFLLKKKVFLDREERNKKRKKTRKQRKELARWPTVVTEREEKEICVGKIFVFSVFISKFSFWA